MFKLEKNEKYLIQENVALCHLVSGAYMKLTNQSKHLTEEKLVQAVKLLSLGFKIFVKILEFHFRKHIFKSQKSPNMVPLAVSRWININLAVSMEPAERRTLVKTADLLLRHMKNVPNSTELKCRLSWIIVQSRIDAKDFESASKLLDKVRFCRH